MIYYSILAINICAFLIMAWDKYKAIHHTWRISESCLLLSALCFGAPGSLLAMILCHHKVRKPKFYLLVPMLCGIQILGILYLRTM